MCVSPRKPAPPPEPAPLPPPTPTVSKATTMQKAPVSATKRPTQTTEANTGKRDSLLITEYKRRRTGRGALRIPLSGGSGLNFPTS